MNFLVVASLVVSLTSPQPNLFGNKVPKQKSDFEIFYQKVKAGFIVFNKPCLYPSRNSRFCGTYKDINHDQEREFLITFTIKF